VSGEPMTDDKCPHCGHVPPPPSAGWYRTDQSRVVKLEDEYEITGTLPVGGLVRTEEPVSMIARRRWTTERLWVRKWAESQWLREGHQPGGTS
jgi:hypothetical protein